MKGFVRSARSAKSQNSNTNLYKSIDHESQPYTEEDNKFTT